MLAGTPQHARSIAEARADNTARRSSIGRRVGDGDVNLADLWPTITRVGAEPEARRGMASAGRTARTRAGSTARATSNGQEKEAKRIVVEFSQDVREDVPRSWRREEVVWKLQLQT